MEEENLHCRVSNLQSTFDVSPLSALILATQEEQLSTFCTPASTNFRRIGNYALVSRWKPRTGCLISLTGWQAILIGRGSVPVCSEPGWYDWLWPLLGLLGPLTGHPVDNRGLSPKRNLDHDRVGPLARLLGGGNTYRKVCSRGDVTFLLCGGRDATKVVGNLPPRLFSSPRHVVSVTRYVTGVSE